MHLQSLKLLRPTVKEMHLQNTLFEGHTKCCPNHLHHVTYTLAKFEVVMSNSLGGDVFTKKQQYLTYDLGSRL